MTPVIEFVDERKIAEIRTELLASVGMSEEALRSRANDYLLTAEEESVLLELDDLAFLESA